MAYVINQVPPQPVVYEQAPPPVIYQAEPQPVVYEQAPPPVIYQAEPQPVVYEQAPPPVIYQAEPQPVVYEQAPPPVIFQAPPQPVIFQAPPQPVFYEKAPPPAQVQPAAVVVQPPMIQSPMKSVPAQTKCGFCQQQIVTITRPINGCLTWTIFGTLLVCLIWPCCLIPLWVKSCKDIEHTCPQCKNVIHIHKRM